MICTGLEVIKIIEASSLVSMLEPGLLREVRVLGVLFF
jgi:hypothetical protein